MSQTGPVAPDRLARVLTMLRYLTAENRTGNISVADVQKDLAMSREEIEADLRLLNLVNHGGGTYLITASMGDESIEVTPEPAGQALAEPVRLFPMMARAVSLALDLLEGQVALEGKTPLESVRRKLEALGPDPHEQRSVTAENLHPPDTEVTRAIARSLNRRRVVSLEYYTPAREELTTREIEPHLMFRTGEAWYLQAYCHLAGAQRTFRLDRIRSATMLSQVFTSRDDLDVSFRHNPEPPFASEGCEWAVLRYPNTPRSVLEDSGIILIDDEGERRDDEEDGFKGRIPFLDSSWLIRHILARGGEEVLQEPHDLRREVAQAAEQLLERYTD